MNKEIRNIDWKNIVIENITTNWECPICGFESDISKEKVIEHIIDSHSNKEIREICSE